MVMRSRIVVRTVICDEAAVLLVDGTLDSSTYRELRDLVIKAGLEEPRAVVVNVTALRVPAPSAYAVFTSARWQISRWPDIPVLLVCGHASGRDTIRRQGISRYIPVYDSADAALAAIDGPGDRPRQRRCAELPPGPACAARASELVTEWLWDWGRGDTIRSARVIASELVNNVVAHTDSVPLLRVEADGAAVTVAVSDHSATPPALIEMTGATFRLSGLHLIAALADAWGSIPSVDGKTVWATITSSN
jgi:hypothetical protein